MTANAADSSTSGPYEPRSPNDPRSTVEDLRRWARACLREAVDHQIEAREATTLVGLVMGWSDAQVYARGEQIPTAQERQRLVEMVERRSKGEPFAYLAGNREFYGRSFQVDSRVLIPRPETELLIETCRELDPPPARILDIGTGSGCIALTLALEIPSATVFACDVSLGALAVARHNLEVLAREDPSLRRRVHLFASDLLTAWTPEAAPIDTFVSNPPYIGDGEQLPPTIAGYEPHVALFSGPAGTEIYQRILTAIATRRGPSRVLFELGADQAPSVISLGQETGFRSRGTRRDLLGWERVLVLDRTKPRHSRRSPRPCS